MGDETARTLRARLPALDAQVLADLADAMGDHHVVRDLVDSFVLDARRRCQMARRALEEGALRDARRAAHALAGSAGTVGAHYLHSLAESLEDATDVLQAN